MMLELARTTMSPPPSARSLRTSSAGSPVTNRVPAQEDSVTVVENTTFVTPLSHAENARSRESAFSSSATPGQKPAKPW
jgi:hypothetical protein